MATKTGARKSASGAAARGRRSKPAWPLAAAKGIGRAIAWVWMTLASALGSTVRRVGDDARDLDPAHHRDGRGLLYLALGVVTGARLWFHTRGFLGHWIEVASVGALGRISLALPVIFLVLAWRWLRTPQDAAGTGRLTIGIGLLVVGACGIWHVALGLPRPADGADAMHAGAGWFGYLVSAPLVAGVGIPVAHVLLSVASLFALMIVTSTPFARIPERFAWLWSLGRRAAARGASALRSRDDGADIGPRVGDEPFEQVVATDRDGDDSEDQSPAEFSPEVLDEVSAPALDNDATGEISRVDRVWDPDLTAPLPALVPASAGDASSASPAATAAGEGNTATVPRKPPAAKPYAKPESALLSAGPPAKERTKANDAVVAALSAVLEDFAV
ncbi:MAG: hypothetical protein RL745_722, partial [Actinomycetota bacterium]